MIIDLLAPPVNKFTVCLVGSEDPFEDLVVEEMESDMWDEEKMKELDELMPVIADHL